MNLAYFPLSLLLPCDAFLTASLASLIYALIAPELMCADRGLLGSGTAPASKGLKYRHKAIALLTYHVGDCLRSKRDGIKISNVKLFVVFIFVWRSIRKYENLHRSKISRYTVACLSAISTSFTFNKHTVLLTAWIITIGKDA